MKKLILAGIAIAFACGTSFAQDTAPIPQPTSPPDAEASPPPPPPPAPDFHRDAPPHGGPKDFRGPPPPLDRSAHFRFENRGLKIDIKCAADQPPDDCAELFLKTLDKVLEGRNRNQGYGQGDPYGDSGGHL